MTIKKLVKNAEKLTEFLKSLDKALENPEMTQAPGIYEDIPMYAREAQKLSNELNNLKSSYHAQQAGGKPITEDLI